MLRAILAYLAGGLRGAGLLLVNFFSLSRIKGNPDLIVARADLEAGLVSQTTEAEAIVAKLAEACAQGGGPGRGLGSHVKRDVAPASVQSENT